MGRQSLRLANSLSTLRPMLYSLLLSVTLLLRFRLGGIQAGHRPQVACWSFPFCCADQPGFSIPLLRLDAVGCALTSVASSSSTSASVPSDHANSEKNNAKTPLSERVVAVVVGCRHGDIPPQPGILQVAWMAGLTSVPRRLFSPPRSYPPCSAPPAPPLAADGQTAQRCWGSASRAWRTTENITSISASAGCPLRPMVISSM